MSAWDPSATISARFNQSDIIRVSNSLDSAHQTPVLQLTSEARSKGYDSICLPLTTDSWKKRWAGMCLLPESGDEKKKRESRRESRMFVSRDVTADKKAESWRENPCFELEEVTITRLDEAEGVTAIISEWLELDTEDDWIRCDAEIALQQELAYASYLNIQTAILPPPRNRAYVSSYARIINACLRKTPYMNLAVRLPVYDPHTIQDPSPASAVASRATANGTPIAPGSPRITMPTIGLKQIHATKSLEAQIDTAWEVWDLIRTICEYNTRLSLALDLSPPLPNSLGVLNKWSAEAVRYIFLPASTFIANAKGYPVLPKPTQTFIRDSMAHRPNIVLSNVASNLHARGGEDAYSQYIKHLESTSPVVQATQKAGSVENFAQGYQDFLQAPLQPLMDNLHSITYQTFEQDPVKYRNYEEAIYKALIDLPEGPRIVICVAGAGRGPLVARSLLAIERSKRNVFIFAVEKNPNAFVTLQHRLRTEWQGKVELLFGDMRQVAIEEKADILVSELLGSFGDNELSPECLDGAMKFLKPGGISIPSSYTAHLAPLSSSKLYNEARSVKDLKSLETPYVVMFQAVNILSGDGGGASGKCGPKIQECWEFEHPRRDVVLNERGWLHFNHPPEIADTAQLSGIPPTNTHNTRSAKLNFHIPHAGVLHGFAGYFEAVLYGSIGLSIHPHRKDSISKDMLSWFPLFFPLREPLYLPSNSELHVSIWRLTNQRQVWYEWHAESFLSIHGMPWETMTNISTPSIGSTPRSTLLTSSPSPGAPSPLIDAVEIPAERRVQRESSDSARLLDGLLKIGHTGLHNAGGRSSWMGL
ncbi:PRMT5-domain-containing protein [Marasmius fiardii PR-910]|nr:PRMT5-domain-containing protein [Marasmius fiardii PR-910]